MKRAIICVDDEKFILMSLKRELEENFGSEFLIKSAISGNDAVDLFQSLVNQGYDIPVIISDYIMPGMKGSELLEIIHKMCPETKTVMLTGQAAIEGITHAVNKAGLYRFLSKPWSREDIVLTISEAIRIYDMKISLDKQRVELERLNSKLMQLDQSKNYFLSLISHELNTPLSVIKGCNEIIRKEANFELQSYCDYIDESVDQLIKFSNYSAIITSLLNDKYRLKLVNDNLQTLIEAVIFNLQCEIDEKRLDMTVSLNYCHYELNFDPSLIEKVIEIIINNAIRYSPNNDKIRIEDSITDDYYELKIVDSGPGFSKDIIENAFELFVSDAIMNHSKGQGLSLAMANIIMKVHQGSIFINNTNGKGAEVRLRFKLKHLLVSELNN